ncbi:uncharacterized protein TNIN_439081 [Trichonephila inaurata madagascariensis]|uniref:Uncharacterized protein n=1 Tax=Trichonephila inaurata madagascariensis TaxID=2747483 RepID=A0A8X6YS85_9ARAC|nr:uncharacterized protein TNIN_439081 [Trichonephila inaurata madagascariensis]
MEVLIDLTAELHSILRTELPDPWVFFRLRQYQDISVILNSSSYLIVHSAFITWFVKHVIIRLQRMVGKRLENKDKYLAMVISGVSAMHLLWPFLISIIRFFTCSFYPWATSIFVLSLYLSFIENTLNIWYIYIYSMVSKYTEVFVEFLTHRPSLAAMTASLPSPPFVFDGTQISLTTNDHIGPSASPVIQPRLDFEKLGKPSEIPKDHIGPSATPVIQPVLPFEKLGKPSDVPEPEAAQKPQDEHHHISESSPGSALDWSFLYSEGQDESYGEGMHTTMEDEHAGDFKFPIEQAEPEHVTKKIHSKRRKKKRATTRQRAVGDTKRGQLFTPDRQYGMVSRHKLGYCGRCWKIFNLPFREGLSKLRQPFTTRLGTPYGPPRYFLTLSQFVAEYGIGVPRRTSVR